MEPELSLPVNELARHCAEEMAHYQRRKNYDPRYCYELFRHALVRQDEEAWSALYHQYHRLVRHWLGNAPGDADALVNQVFGRLWRAIPSERFVAFPTLDGILGYLKRCTQSLAIDVSRQAEREQVYTHALERSPELTGQGRWTPSVEWILNEVVGQQLYEYVMGTLHSALERLVFRASVEWDLKPRMIAQRWPELFNDAREVSRIKERIYRRLQQDQEFRAMLGMNGGLGKN